MQAGTTKKKASEKEPKSGGESRGGNRQDVIDAVAKHILTYGRIDQVLAHGENKVSFTLSNGLQVDVRLLEKENFGRRAVVFHRLEGTQRPPCVAARMTWAGP